MYHSKKFVLLNICFSIIWWSCAGQVAPEGGPKDIDPPNIIGVYPEPNSTNVETDVIRFQFSKYVNRQSFQQALFISPLITDMEVTWRGRNVELRLHESLRENTTYSITIGTDLVDTREGTRLAEAFTLAFSTGDEIDQGQITGTVFYDEPVGVLLFAYYLQDSLMADTLNPQVQEPDYITQTGKDGRFRLPYLRFGEYRIIAIRDEFQNRLYDPDTDPYGVYVEDISLTEESPIFEDVTIRMHKPDFTKPFVSRVTSINSQKLSLRFSKPIDPNSITLESFRIYHSETSEPLGVNSYSIRRSNPDELYLFTESQSDAEYILHLDSTITDLSGNMLRSDGLEESFTGKQEGPDSPIIVEYVHPRSQDQNVRPDSEITLQFSYPVKSERTEEAITVIDTNEISLPGEFYWEDETTIVFMPSQLMASKMQYTVSVVLDSLPAINDLHYQDSLFTSIFTILDRDMLGAIEGELITDQDTVFTIKFERIGSGTQKELYSLSRRGRGNFSLRNVPEGQYSLWTFVDPAGQGEYEYGEVYPFRGSAPFINYPDTIRVRARWTVDGIILDMRKYEEVPSVEAAEVSDE